MPMVTAENVLDFARVYLNDTPGNQWNNTVLLPYLKLAWDEINIELQIRDIMVMDEASAALVIAADVTTLDPPADLITPFSMMERPRGGSDNDWAPMTPVPWESLGDNGTTLGNWTWREQQFYFPKHSSDVEVMIQYLKALVDIADEHAPLQLNNCRVVLAKRCAALAARYGNSNPTRADQLDVEAQYFMNMLTGIEVKTKQNTQGVRRKGYGFRRKFSQR